MPYNVPVTVVDMPTLNTPPHLSPTTVAMAAGVTISQSISTNVVSAITAPIASTAVLPAAIAGENVVSSSTDSTENGSVGSGSSNSDVDPDVRLYCCICRQLGQPIVYYTNGNSLCAHMLSRHPAYFGQVKISKAPKTQF